MSVDTTLTEAPPKAPPSGHFAAPVRRSAAVALTLGGLGVVFGDVGTSSLYALHRAE
jgi:hypothetical protein